ncbi:unnamed protein product [Globisporangium polare]
MKVAVIGVTGAFRSGKSFLLSLMLRYLSRSGPGSPLIPDEGGIGDLLYLQPETFLGDPATYGDLLRFAKRYVEVFQESSSFPSAEAIAAAMKDEGNEKVKQEALKKYVEEMESFKDPVCKLISDSTMSGRHLASKKKALELLDEGAILRGGSKANATRKELAKAIESEFLRFKTAYKERNTAITVVMAAAASVALAAVGAPPPPWRAFWL